MKCLSVTALGITFALAGFGALPLQAQTANPFPDPDNSSGQDIDIWNNRSENMGSVYNLINRLQMINGRSAGEFAEDQDENFNSAISDFKQRQQEQLEQPTLVTPDTGDISSP